MPRSCRSHPVSFTHLATCVFSAFVAVLASPPCRAATPPHVVLTSPVAGASWVRPETSLLVRFDSPLAPTGAGAVAPAFTVTGSRSGPHPGRAVVADGGHAVIFRPTRPFAYDEHVTVVVGDPGAGGTALPPFEFSTSRAPAALPDGARLPDSFLDDPATHAMVRAMLPTFAAPVAGPTPFSMPAPTQRTLDESAGGVLFLAPLSFSGATSPFLLIQDPAGTPIFKRDMPGPCFDFKLQLNGRMSYFDSAKWEFTVLDNAYQPVDSFECGNGFPTDVHELRILPNGHALLLGTDPQLVDMSTIVPGGNPNATVIGNVIQELDEEKNVVFEWRTFDHFKITDATHEDLTAATIDDVHANALELDTDGNILLSSRHLDEITKIDHASGAILWRMGGKNNQFSLFNDYEWFSHQHAIRRIANGHVTLFDNGNFHSPPFSRALEYSLDEVNKVATLTWEFDNYPEYGLAMGYVERLDDGSTLVSFGTGAPAAIQVRADGSVSSVLQLQPGESSYRVLRQAYQPAAAVGDLATPALTLSNAVPSPFRETTSLFVTLAHPSPVALQVFDVSGRKVLDVSGPELHAPGVSRLPVDLQGVPEGVYFARVTTNAGSATRRLVHLP